MLAGAVLHVVEGFREKSPKSTIIVIMSTSSVHTTNYRTSPHTERFLNDLANQKSYLKVPVGSQSSCVNRFVIDPAHLLSD